MNEVNSSPVSKVTPQVLPAVTRAASSNPLDKAVDLPLVGKKLPVDDMAKGSSPLHASTIEQAVIEINEYVQSVQRDLHFSVDKDSGLTIIRVRDKESGDLIRQIPEDVFLNLAQNLKDNQAIYLFDAHG